ncbi:hypothetical protein O7623_31175 [Solwaraspora sp. WMMD791]|uniref:hypothetical protein n=1 Tax=Solwaraspora sp. WMMD791 TaxID=3016086 RepID=UPI00249AC20D|nr:hypothetical protein [Solwaraspora sp. WMMD791]WFE27620.1 hypothetical protein O7623_31175 [Solwaraspora sp. WMMD791]
MNELRGWAARKLMHEDGKWVADLARSTALDNLVAAYVGLFLSHHFVRIAHEGATAIRSTSSYVGIPEFATQLSNQYTAITARSRHTTKILDDTKKTMPDVLAEFREELVMHRNAFTGKAKWWARWAESDLGLYFLGDSLIGATVPASYRLGINPCDQAVGKTGQALAEVSREWGGAVAAMCGATFINDGPEATIDFSSLTIRTRDCLADQYLAGRFETLFSLELKLLLLLIEGDLNTSRLVLPLTAHRHQGAVFRAQTITAYHCLTALRRIAGLYPDLVSPAITQLRTILDTDSAKRVTSAAGLRIRNRCVHYEMNDPRFQPNLTMPMCGLVEALLPGHTFASFASDVSEVTAVVAKFLARWHP